MTPLTLWRRFKRIRALRARQNQYATFPTMRDILNSIRRCTWKLTMYSEQRRLDEAHRARMMVLARGRRQLRELIDRGIGE